MRSASVPQRTAPEQAPSPGTPLTPIISVEEDEDSKEPQLQVRGLPALSVDGKLLALYFANHAVTVTSEQSLVIDAPIHDAVMKQFVAHGAYVVNAAEKKLLENPGLLAM